MVRINETGKVSFKEAIKHFFKGFFDFRGQTTRQSFWWSMIVVLGVDILGLMILEFLPLMVFSYGLSSISLLSGLQSLMQSTFLAMIIFLIISLFLIIFQIGVLALISRRLRHVGLKPLGITLWLILFIIVESRSFNHDELGFFIFLLQLVIGLIQLILLCLPKNALVVSKNSSLSHFIKEEQVEKTDVKQVIQPKKTLSQVDLDQLSTEKKHLH